MFINAFVLAVPEANKDEYIRISKSFAKLAIEYGALEVCENWEFEIPDGEHTDYRKAVKAKPGEKIVFSWIVWPDRETFTKVHKNMFADPRMAEMGEMPFDGKRMIFGDFETIVSYRKDSK
jgi:uncharacterized protein YbaA (DUF1428 family)